MDKYVCSVCGYVYDPAEGDPDNGIEPGTKFDDLPDDWECPVCGAGKSDFEKAEKTMPAKISKWFGQADFFRIYTNQLSHGRCFLEKRMDDQHTRSNKLGFWRRNSH